MLSRIRGVLNNKKHVIPHLNKLKIKDLWLPIWFLNHYLVLVDVDILFSFVLNDFHKLFKLYHSSFQLKCIESSDYYFKIEYLLEFWVFFNYFVIPIQNNIGNFWQLF